MVSDLLMGGAKEPKIPEAKMPAQAAPRTREDTGADVIIGADSGKNARVSGRRSGQGGSSSGGGDVLGGLGQGGLSI